MMSPESVTGNGNPPLYEVEERSFATEPSVIRHYAQRLYDVQVAFIQGDGDFFAMLGPLGILERHGVPVSSINTVIRAANRRLPFPHDLFPVSLSS